MEHKTKPISELEIIFRVGSVDFCPQGATSVSVFPVVVRRCPERGWTFVRPAFPGVEQLTDPLTGSGCVPVRGLKVTVWQGLKTHWWLLVGTPVCEATAGVAGPPFCTSRALADAAA